MGVDAGGSGPRPHVSAALDAVIDRAASLAAGGRALLGITGAPGSGKTTLAQSLARSLGPERAVVVGMDGFHLANTELRRLGRTASKGAPDTFDALGFLALLRRLAEPDGAGVYAPCFDRGVDEAVGGSVLVAAEVPLVVVEGNYLLLSEQPWAQVRPLLAECWYVQLPRGVRERRLISRHQRFGESAVRARAHALGSDAANAALVEPTAARADLVL